MIAKLHIQASGREGITYLKQNYFSPPFKVANITENKKAVFLHLMLMSSSPGILDGDEYSIKLDVDADCSLQLHTQSYQRLFTMKNGARQMMEVVLQKGSSFIYLPHPSVPHQNSIFTAINKIYLTNACRLIWGEILTCGRKLNGEVFQLSKYHNLTHIYLNNKLVIRENLLIQPASINPASMGQLEGFTHQASLIILDEQMDIDSIQDEVTELLASIEDIAFGITTAPIHGIIVRILGNKAEQLHNGLQSIALLVQHITQRAFAA